jgi:hypothetical protein
MATQLGETLFGNVSPEAEYKRRLDQFMIGGRGAGFGFEPRLEDFDRAHQARKKIFGEGYQIPERPEPVKPIFTPKETPVPTQKKGGAVKKKSSW